MHAMNAVEARMQELASFGFGPRKKIICKVRRREMIPNQRYSWLLFEKEADLQPLETVVLDVSLAEAREIDASIGAEPDIYLWS